MKILISVPSGYHVRELLLPLKDLLEHDPVIDRVVCLTPGAQARTTIFPEYGPKFEFIANPSSAEGHEELFQKLLPDIVVTTTSGLDPKDVPTLEAAKKVGIKTFTFIASWDNVWKMERMFHQKNPPALADHLAVWNTMMQEHLLRIGKDLRHEQISISGVPRFDYFWHHDRIPSRADLYRYLGFTDPYKKLLHIATTELYPMGYLVEAIATAARQEKLSSGVHLYASVHPGGDIAKHKPYTEKYGVTALYSFGRRENAPHPDFRYNPSLEDIYMLVALFKHSSVLVNHSSTVAIESFASDVPVINIKYGEPLDWWNWYRSMVYRDFQQHYKDIVSDGATTVVTHKKQLLPALNTYLEHPDRHRENRAKTLQKLITVTDGSASAKMLALIKQHAL